MTKTIQDIRMELAKWGVEMTPEDLHEVLQAAAHIAQYIGGKVTIDSESFWGLYVEIDEKTPGECWVDLVAYAEEYDEPEIEGGN